MRRRRSTQDIKTPNEILSKTEPYMCSYFGCGRQLTLHESLCGNKCTTHQRPHIITVRNFNNKKIQMIVSLKQIQHTFIDNDIDYKVNIYEDDKIHFEAFKNNVSIFYRHDSVEKIKQSLFTNIHKSPLKIQHELVTIRFVKMCYGYMYMQKLIS